MLSGSMSLRCTQGEERLHSGREEASLNPAPLLPEELDGGGRWFPKFSQSLWELGCVLRSQSLSPVSLCSSA